MIELDIVIPVYNEGAQIRATLSALERHVRTPFRVLICYDDDDDDTLQSVRASSPCRTEVVKVKNRGRGVLGAVVTGLQATSAPAVLILPADDDYNAARIDRMVALCRDGFDVVCANRFDPESRRCGYPWRKAILVRMASLGLFWLAGVPTHDASNGFRLFSRRVIDAIPVETPHGHAYSIELLVKAHRSGWRIAEVPVDWFERSHGESRFQILRWLPSYLVWFRFALVGRRARNSAVAEAASSSFDRSPAQIDSPAGSVAQAAARAPSS